MNKTRTDRILASVCAEIERRRASLDANALLAAVTLTVRLDVRRGAVREVEMAERTVRTMGGE